MTQRAMSHAVRDCATTSEFLGDVVLVLEVLLFKIHACGTMG